MDEKCFDDEIVTKFLLNTCRLRPQLSEHVVEALQCIVPGKRLIIQTTKKKLTPFR